jgi:hypothetical protein
LQPRRRMQSHLGAFQSAVLLFLLISTEASTSKYQPGELRHQSSSSSSSTAGKWVASKATSLLQAVVQAASHCDLFLARVGPLKPAGIAKSCQYTVCPPGAPGVPGTPGAKGEPAAACAQPARSAKPQKWEMTPLALRISHSSQCWPQV